MKSLQLMPRGVAALLVVVTPLLAQPVVTLSPSAAPDRTPAALAPRPESNPSLAALLPPPRVAPFQSGPFALRPHASFSYVHSDGLLVQPGEQLTTSIYSVSAGCIVDLGTHWSFDYTGLKSWYSNDAFRNSFDHTAALSGGTQYEDWSFRLGHVYATSSAPLVETGRQTKQHTHVTSLFVGRALGSRAGVEVTAEQQLRSAEDAPSSHEWPVNAWFNYRIAPDLDVAVGLGGGFADIEPGANQLYRRPQARVSWRPRDTLTLRLSGGEEHRTFYGHTTSKLRRPVFDGAIEYRPTRTTRLTAHGGREVAVSYFTSQVSENTLQG
ncbi:MAG TPA: hypothetical protein VNR00_11210, partial [Opitutus sp.]|nr:hypothetical protein [Opitutus sp.]